MYECLRKSSREKLTVLICVDLRLIVRDLIDKLRKDLEGGEKINYEEAEKSFFTYQDQYSEAGNMNTCTELKIKKLFEITKFEL